MNYLNPHQIYRNLIDRLHQLVRYFSKIESSRTTITELPDGSLYIRNPTISAAMFLATFERYKRNAKLWKPDQIENTSSPQQLKLDLEERI